jgi:hypothetical protein
VGLGLNSGFWASKAGRPLHSRCSINWAIPLVHIGVVILVVGSCELFVWGWFQTMIFPIWASHIAKMASVAWFNIFFETCSWYVPRLTLRSAFYSFCILSDRIADACHIAWYLIDLYCLNFIHKLFIPQHILLERVLTYWQLYTCICDRNYENTVPFIELSLLWEK